jgi:hypothetical protein
VVSLVAPGAIILAILENLRYTSLTMGTTGLIVRTGRIASQLRKSDAARSFCSRFE